MNHTVPHAIAAGVCLLFAYGVSQTAYVTTGVQFVAPFGIVLAVHLVWIGMTRGFFVGYAAVAVQRSLATSAVVVLGLLLANIMLPLPATATTTGGFEAAIGFALMTFACTLMVAIVAGVVGLVLFLVYYAGVLIVRLYRKYRGTAGPDRGVNDFGAVVAMLIAVVVASLEGVTSAYSFAQQDTASRQIEVSAPATQVWQQIARATSPEFPLPILLKSVPQPIAVLVDEGAHLGARRIVQFRGREGTGDLALRVTRRTETEAVFTTQTDTSPMASWVRQKSITFRVEPAGEKTLLTVTIDYDRLLSPAWFFRPYVRLASYLAVDVLARDTAVRAVRQ